MKTLLASFALIAAHASAQTITIHTDPERGIRHVIATTDEGAYFGAGYAAAKDRWFQMCLSRLYIDGRLAEYFADAPDPQGQRTAKTKELIDFDKYARVLNLRRAADRRRDELAIQEAETTTMLASYVAGVNKYREEHVDHFNNTTPNAFEDTNFDLVITNPLPPGTTTYAGQDFDREWTVSDCIAVWLRFTRPFQSFGKGEWNARMNYDDSNFSVPQPQVPIQIEPLFDELNTTPIVCDNSATTMRRGDFANTQADLAAVTAFASNHGIPTPEDTAAVVFGCNLPPVPPVGFSEAAAIDRSRTNADRNAMMSMPRISVTYPSSMYEWYMQGPTFKVRGAGFPGSPNLLCGANAEFAWGVTAATVDMTDVFVFEPHPTDPTKYLWVNGGQIEERAWEYDEPVDLVVANNQPDPSHHVRVYGTHVGPVVSGQLVFKRRLVNENGLPRHKALTIRSMLFDRPELDCAAAMLEMYRVTTNTAAPRSALEAFHDATSKWTFPSANLVFAHKTEGVGYALVGNIPVRAFDNPLAGRIALDLDSRNEWQYDSNANGTLIVPNTMKPHVLDPMQSGDDARSYIASANNLPAGMWHPMFGLFTSDLGGNARYRRLDTLLATDNNLTTQEMRDIMADTVRGNVFDITDIANAMVTFTASPGGTAMPAFTSDQIDTLTHLTNWQNNGNGTMSATDPGVVFAYWMKAAKLQGFHPIVAGESTPPFGQGSGAMSLFLDRMLTKSSFTKNEILTIQMILDEARERVETEGGHDLDVHAPDQWRTDHIDNQLELELNYFHHNEFVKPIGSDIDPFAMDPSVVFDLDSRHSGTMHDSKSATFNQFAYPGFTNSIESMLPPGNSGVRNSPRLTDQAAAWSQGLLFQAHFNESTIGSFPSFTVTMG